MRVNAENVSHMETNCGVRGKVFVVNYIALRLKQQTRGFVNTKKR